MNRTRNISISIARLYVGAKKKNTYDSTRPNSRSDQVCPQTVPFMVEKYLT